MKRGSIQQAGPSLLIAVLVVIWLVFQSSAAHARVDDTPKPIPTDATVRTQADYDKTAQALMDRTLISTFRERHEGNDPWYDEAIQFIHDEDAWAQNDRTAGSAWTFFDRIANLTKAGCTDPLFYYRAGRVYETMSGTLKGKALAIDMWRKVIDNKAEGYSSLLLGRAASKLQAAVDGTDEKTLYAKIAQDAYLEALAGNVFLPEDGTYLCVLFRPLITSPVPVDVAATFMDRLAAIPGVSESVLETCRGIQSKDLAWRARGSGTIDTVTAKGYQEFQQKLLVAREQFTKAWNADPSNPIAPSDMIVVAMALSADSGESPRLWFDRAVSAVMDWPDAYNNYQLCLEPKWGGSYRALIEFGIECAETRRYDTVVPGRLSEVVLLVRLLRGDSDWIRNEELYGRLRESLQGISDQYPVKESLKSYRSRLLGFAWFNRDFATARKMMDILSEDYYTNTFSDLGGDYLRCLEEIVQNSSPGAIDAEAGEFALNNRDYETAMKKFQDALAASEGDVQASALFRSRIAQANFLSAFGKGEWTSVQFAEGMPGWRIKNGDWIANPDGSVRGQIEAKAKAGNLRSAAEMYCASALGSKYEVDLEIDLSASDARANKRLTTARFYVCATDPLRRPIDSMRITIPLRAKGEAEMAAGLQTSNFPIAATDKPRHVNLKVWDDQIVVTIDDSTLYAGYRQPTGGEAPGEYFGLGVPREPVQFSKLRIRTLLEKPTELK